MCSLSLLFLALLLAVHVCSVSWVLGLSVPGVGAKMTLEVEGSHPQHPQVWVDLGGEIHALYFCCFSASCFVSYSFVKKCGTQHNALRNRDSQQEVKSGEAVGFGDS